MAYAIERGEPVPVAIPRIVLERIDTAYEQLLDTGDDIEERIHNARKRLKECRAAIRLIRLPLGGEFATENLWFRDAGRALAALRDADARLEAAEGLRDHASGFHERRVLRRLNRRLHAARRADRSELERSIANTAERLSIARTRVRGWPPLPQGFGAIGKGFARTYRDGRRAASDAIEMPTPERCHEWRKRVKDHWYHVQILRNVWPAVMDPYRQQMEEQSDALGDRHDLDVLRQSIVQGRPFGNRFDLSVLLSLIDRRIAELTATAVWIGKFIYAEPAEVVEARFEKYWEAWNAMRLPRTGDRDL